MLAWIALFALVSAADPQPEEIEVVGSSHDVDATEHRYHSSTVFKLENYYGYGQSLDAVVAKAPGVYLRRSGGFGAQTLLSVRGLSGSNIGVILDDLPLSSVGFSAADLSLFPLELLGSVEIFRGDGPIRFQAPLGGLIHLRTRKPQTDFEFHSHLGLGSFYNRSAHVAVLAQSGTWDYMASVAYRGTQGNFSFYNDQGTLYSESDDREETRQNNESDTGAVHFSFEHSSPSGSSQAIRGHSTYRVRGVPGLGVQPTVNTHAKDWEMSLRLTSEFHHFFDESWIADVGLDLLRSSRSFRDPGIAPYFLPELSMRAEQDASLWQVGIDGRIHSNIHSDHRLEVAPRFVLTSFHQTGGDNELSAETSTLRRLSLDVGLGAEYLWTVFEGLTLGPGLRFDAWLPQSSDSFLPSTHLPQVSPRMIIHWQSEHWRLYANAGRRHRFPTLLELYGDNISIGPSPALESESGMFGDVGFATEFEPLEGTRVHFSLTGFVSFPDNLIVFMQNSQKSVKAMNVARSTLAGLEGSVTGEARWSGFDLHYSFIHARDTGDVVGLRGNTPPGIAKHQLDLTLRAGPDWLELAWELNLRSKRYLDRANLRPIPAAALQALMLRVEFSELKLGLKARLDNIADVRRHLVEIPGRNDKATVQTSDLIGYPLEGRTFFVSIEWYL